MYNIKYTISRHNGLSIYYINDKLKYQNNDYIK